MLQRTSQWGCLHSRDPGRRGTPLVLDFGPQIFQCLDKPSLNCRVVCDASAQSYFPLFFTGV